MRAVWFTVAAVASKRAFAWRTIMSASIGGRNIRDRWKNLASNRGGIFLTDGGTGEEIFQRGVPDDRKIWSATALVHKKYQSVLKDVHRSFLEAGSDAITTNSYGVVPGVGFTTEEIEKYVATAGRIARETVNDYHEANNSSGDKMPPRLVLGSLGPLIESYRPDKIMEPKEGIQMYSIIARALLPYIDIFIAETMSCLEESAQAIQAVGQLRTAEQQNDGYKPPMLVSYTLDSEGRLRNGELPTSAMARTIALCQENKVELLGVLFNCAEPESISKAIKSIHDDAELQQSMKVQGVMTGAYANRLTPVDPDWTLAESDAPQGTRDDLSMERYSDEFVSSWIKDSGVSIVGGCCGITPAYIEHIHKSLHTDSGSAAKKKTIITFVTGNQKKLEEAEQLLLPDADAMPFILTNRKLDLPELQGDPIEIAKEKCRMASKSVNGPVLTEDTSLCFNALNGLPGPYIKWFLEKCGHDGLNRMLVGFDDKSAYAQTVAAFTLGPDEEVHVFDGRTEGRIVQPRGKLDFGWDPIFEPTEGGGKTYAEMENDEKNAISHRGRSFAKLKQFLSSL